MKTRTRWLFAVIGLAAVTLTACQTSRTQQGALMGSVLGAGAGAIIGNQSGKSGEGALIGAGAGALTGALIGDAVNTHKEKEAAKAQQGTAAPAASQPAAAQPAAAQPTAKGHYETRVVTTESGETYEERVWVPDK